MSAPPEIARENGKKGGRPKGSKAAHTLQAEAYRKYIIQEVVKKKGPLVKALIDKGLDGNVSALKEIHERVLGRVTDTLDMNYGSETIEALKQQLKGLFSSARERVSE
jgi:hypothetical protein